MTNQELLQIYSAYLPYGVGFKCIDIYSGEYEISTLKYINIPFEEIGVGYMDYDFSDLGEGELLMCLRPLSDLTKEIEHNGEKFVPVERIEEIFGLNSQWIGWGGVNDGMMHFDYEIVQKLLEWHFDVFSLIDKKLAINLNEVK